MLESLLRSPNNAALQYRAGLLDNKTLRHVGISGNAFENGSQSGERIDLADDKAFTAICPTNWNIGMDDAEAGSLARSGMPPDYYDGYYYACAFDYEYMGLGPGPQSLVARAHAPQTTMAAGRIR